MAKAMARHILVANEEQARRLKERLAAGEPFDVLARKHSICPRPSVAATSANSGPASWCTRSTRWSSASPWGWSTAR